MSKKGYDDFTDYGDPDSFEILDKNLPMREKREIRRRKEYEENIKRASENRGRKSERYDDDYDSRSDRYGDDYERRSDRYDDDYDRRSDRYDDDYDRCSDRYDDDYDRRPERYDDDYDRRSDRYDDDYERRSDRYDDYDRRPDRRDEGSRRPERRDEDRAPRRDEGSRRPERRDEGRAPRRDEGSRHPERRDEGRAPRRDEGSRHSERRDEERSRRSERRDEERSRRSERRDEERAKRRNDEKNRRSEKRDEDRRIKLKKQSDKDDFYTAPYPKKKGRGWIKALIAVLIALVLVFVAVFGAFSTITKRFTHVDTVVSERFTSMKGAKINVLLVGDDARDGQGGQRSDTIILCSINPLKHSVAFISIMRDTYVSIPGYANNRVNASYAFGGLDLLNQTVEENFDVKIDGNAVVNFDGFMEAMAAVGPLDIELTAEEANYMNNNTGLGAADDGAGGVEVWNLTEGVNSLTASQLLCYARMRAVGNSDWDRTERQRRLMSAAISKIKHGHFISGYKMAYEAAPYVKTDINTMGYLKMAMEFLLSGSPESYRIPVDGTYSGQMVDGMAVLVPDLEANKEYLKQFMNGQGLEEESSTEE